jgi:hypothetical protein
MTEQDEGTEYQEKGIGDIFAKDRHWPAIYEEETGIYRETPEMEIMNFNNGLCKAQ